MGTTNTVDYQGSAWVNGYPGGTRIGSYQRRSSGTRFIYSPSSVAGTGRLRFDNEYAVGSSVKVKGNFY